MSYSRKNDHKHREAVFARDKGVCEVCRTDCAAPGLTWQMDHILPVSENGGQRGMDNLRTLCIGCHHKETGRLAGRNAKAKRMKAKHETFKTYIQTKKLFDTPITEVIEHVAEGRPIQTTCRAFGK